MSALTRVLFLTSFLYVVYIEGFSQHEALRQKLLQLTSSFKGEAGIALMNVGTGDTLTINNSRHYPMQSVYKFPLALAVLHEVDRKKFQMDQKIHITKGDMLPDTWSPLADKYPNGEVDLTLKEILQATVSISDNNGCDILFRLLGGPLKVDKYVKRLGVTDMSIEFNEEEMHLDWDTQFDNWSTPYAMLSLLYQFQKNAMLSKDSYYFLWNAMKDTPTGANRIKALLPEDAVVVHKTGTGGRNSEGILGAVNDAAIIVAPKGETFILVVFLSNIRVSESEAEHLTANIAKTVYDYFVTNK